MLLGFNSILKISAFAQQGVGGEEEVDMLLKKERKEMKASSDSKLIEFAIGKSYQILPSTAREHLLALSVFPAAFTLSGKLTLVVTVLCRRQENSLFLLNSCGGCVRICTD